MASHDDIAFYLDNANFSNLNRNMQNFINFITGGITGNPVIQCTVITDNTIKPNLEIIINGIFYYVSVLDGHGNSVHEEKPADILTFLRMNGATPNEIDFVRRLCASSMHTTDFIQTELRTNPNLVSSVRDFFHINRTNLIIRALQTGIHNGQPTQFIYWGDINSGYVRDINYVVNLLSLNISNTRLISVGGLTLQRKDRFVNNNIQLKWPNPEEDLA